jgi:folate-binding protein YgfZ
VIATTEYERLRESVGLVDRSPRAKLRLVGADAADYLQGQVTNDVEALEPGQGCYATLLTPKGQIVADMRVLRGDGLIWIDLEMRSRDAMVRNVQMYSIGRDVHLTDASNAYAIFSLIGPAARDVVETAPPDVEYSWIEGEHGMYVATDLGVDVICRAVDAEGVRQALGVEPASSEAAELLRVESGRPRLGYEIAGGVIPQEAGLNERAVSFTKGCYVGQETVARLYYKGKPNRHLRGLRLSADDVVRGDEVTFGDRVVGKIGTAAVSPAHGPIALAILRREVGPGDTVKVGADGVDAEVADLPFSS